MHTCRTMFHFWKRGNGISIAARPTQDSQRSTGSSTASSGWSISASRTSCSAGGPWRSSAGCWAQRWLRRCRARLPAPVPATGICYAEGLAKGLGKPMVNALEKLHRPNNRTLCFADVERRTGLIRDHMKLTGEDLQGKQVVVVDEAIFMGTTLRIVCQMLREAGAAKAHIAIPTPMSNCRCAQYVLPAMPSLADSMPPSKMLDYFGADSLTYIPGQSFLEIARPSGAVCTDCFEA